MRSQLAHHQTLPNEGHFSVAPRIFFTSIISSLRPSSFPFFVGFSFVSTSFLFVVLFCFVDYAFFVGAL